MSEVKELADCRALVETIVQLVRECGEAGAAQMLSDAAARMDAWSKKNLARRASRRKANIAAGRECGEHAKTAPDRARVPIKHESRG
jgi:hypothetical protein